MQITVVRDDITTQAVDAVVNAANRRMRGGGGVDGAIHAAGELPARWVVHVVGPDRTAGETDRRLLVSCYARALEVADELGARSLALPLVGAGVYGWSASDSVTAALEVLRTCDSGLEEARFVAFGQAAYDVVSAAL